MRAALYARFSTDLQSAASIPDQLRDCRRLAAQLGAEVVREFEDAAISGRAIGNRPGMLELMHVAKSGAFDVVIAEHTDRLSRSGADSWAIFEDLRALGITIHTVAQGAVGTMHVGLSGTMSALLLEETARKTRRGLEGVARAGRSAGGLSYGYRKVIAFDERGEQIRGLREVVDAEADVVRRIFREYAQGRSPRAIAASLNTDGVPGPTGGPWNATTISGNAKRGNGVLHNELYRGEIVWGRNAWVKDRATGKRRSRAGHEPHIVRQAAPELRIVDQELWEEVRARYATVAETAAGGRPELARRPRRLLSGLVRCGVCGGRMTLSGPKGAMRCQVRVERGPAGCTNTRTPGYAGIEGRVLGAVKANLLQPEIVEAAVREYHALAAKRDRARARDRLALERELAEVGRRAARLVDQIADGEVQGRAVAEKLAKLEARREELEAELAAEIPSKVTAHPSTPQRYRQLVERLQEAMAPGGPALHEEARAAVRGLISEVRFVPLPGHGVYALDVVAEIAPLLRVSQQEGDARVTLGAGVGFEPTTFRL